MRNLLIFLYPVSRIDVKESPRHLELAVVVSPMNKEHASFSQKLCLLPESRIDVRRFGDYWIETVSAAEEVKFFRIAEGNEPSCIFCALPSPLTAALQLGQLILVTIGLIFLNMKSQQRVIYNRSLHKFGIK